MKEIYDDDFFEGLDGVANALDNIDASEYRKKNPSLLYSGYSKEFKIDNVCKYCEGF